MDKTTLRQGPSSQAIDPTIHWAIQQQQAILNIQTVRLAIIQDLTEERGDFTQGWFQTLLRSIQYPHADILLHELTNGFPLIRNLQPGLNWKVRTDTKYTETQSRAELHTYNRQYILKKLQQGRVDARWNMMAVVDYQVRPTPSAPTHTKTQRRPDPVIALAFSIEQTGSDGKPKVRRGEDWRRSGHNRSCDMTDQPYHRTPDHYLWLAQHTAGADHTSQHEQVWGHDRDGAYRQLPLDDPSLAYVLLLTPEGPTLWLHHVLLFGSAASVWSYNQSIRRRIDGSVTSPHSYTSCPFCRRLRQHTTKTTRRQRI